MLTNTALGFLVNLRDLLTLQRKPEISVPCDVIHITHVSFDESTGQYTGLPKEWVRFLASSPEPKSKPDVPGEDAQQSQPPELPPKERPSPSSDLSPLAPAEGEGQIAPDDLHQNDSEKPEQNPSTIGEG